MKAKLAGAAMMAMMVGGCTVVPPQPEVTAPVVETPAPAAAPTPAVPAGVPGIATTGTDRWYKDQYGRCYRVNEQGDRVYDSTRQCG